MNKKLRRFFKYSVVGVSTFGFDLLMLWFLTEVCGVHYLFATPAAFLIAVSVNYFVSRRVVFKETERGVKLGYMYFLAIVICGVGLTLGIMYILVNFAQLNIIVARIMASGFIGIFNFLMNDRFNFKMN